MIWKAERIWEGETAFLLAGGPSLRGFEAKVLRKPGYRVLAINDSWRLAPWLDCLYFTDATWYTQQLQKDPWALDVSINFGQLLYKKMFANGSTPPAFADHPQIKQLKLTGQDGLETDPSGLRHGSNSTYAAMNLAYHFGVKRIVLLGLDMRVVKGRTHWHDSPRPDGYADVLWQSHKPHYQTLVEPLQSAGVDVLNATPGSALTCWPIVTLESILKGEAQWRRTQQPASA